MTFNIDLHVLELVASRLCHDVVGPIGAINNGLEMLEDEDFGMADDALALIGKSAKQAANALQFFRLAYGMAGARVGSDLSELRGIAQNYLGHGKIELDWASVSMPDSVPDGAGKLLLNIIALAEEALVRGGTITVHPVTDTDEVRLVVTAQGVGCGLRDESREALADGVAIEDLTPRSVHGYFTRQLAQRLEGDLRVEEAGSDSIALTVVLAK